MKDDWDGLKRHLEVLLQENSTVNKHYIFTYLTAYK
jgi:hypothetical protein